jgi:hypothetical protein
MKIQDEQILNLDFFVPTEYGLTLQAEAPRVNPQVMLSGNLELLNNIQQSYYVPQCRMFVVSIICKFGLGHIRENYADNTIYTICDTLNMFRAVYNRTDVEKIFITGIGDDDLDGPSKFTYVISRMY